MSNEELRTTEDWVDLIAHSELPAITSTAALLDKFSNDDKSSLPKLSQAILHDQGLCSCLLKVANNSKSFRVNKVTTVSRASVVLGIQTVKNICLTAKLVSSLLNSKNMDINVYERLTQLMANSFYAGQLAKMMVSNYSEEMQEEMYLSAMLYRIGETAFWSVGGEVASQLALYKSDSQEGFNDHCNEALGISFNELSQGLAGSWGLSDLLKKSLDEPTTRTKEVKIVYYADKLSSIISKPEGLEEEYTELLDDIAKLMGITVKQLKVRINHIHTQAEKLLSSFGAELLTANIKSLPTKSDFNSYQRSASAQEIAKNKSLLDGFMALTKLIGKSKDFNEYLQTALTKIALAFLFDSNAFLMLADNQTKVKSRFIFDQNGEADSRKVNITINDSDNIISRVFKADIPALVNDYKEERWRDYFTQEIADMTGEGAVAFIPVKIGAKAIGVICLQKFGTEEKIEINDFREVCTLVEHLNMCLTMIKYK